MGRLEGQTGRKIIPCAMTLTERNLSLQNLTWETFFLSTHTDAFVQVKEKEGAEEPKLSFLFA